MSRKLLVIIDISPDARRQLEEAGFEVVLAGEHGGREAAVEASTAAVAVFTNGSLGLTGDEIARLPDLRMIAAIGAGFEKIDLDAAAARGIVVTNGRGTNTVAVADHAMTLLLAIAGTIVPSYLAVKAGGWSNFSSPKRDAALPGERTDFPFKRIGVTGRKLGIFGLGTIGSAIATRAANGFAMEIGYTNRSPVDGSPWRFVPDLRDLAAWADFLVLAAPGGAGTYHIVGREVLERLGPEGYLVNIGRGSVVDTDALVDALQRRAIAGAALDVVEGEPDIPPVLLTLDNLLLTPHMAGRTAEAIAQMVELAVRNFAAFFAGEPVVNRVA